MSDGNVVELPRPASPARDALTAVLREGAQRRSRPVCCVKAAEEEMASR